MAKKRTVRKAKQAKQGPNWLLIGGIAAAVLVVGGLFYLLFLSLQDQDTPQVARPLSEYCLENPDNCVSKGSTSAPVNIVEVSDYACNHCRDFNLDTAPIIDERYVNEGEVFWTVLPYALSRDRIPAAAASMCASEQDAFFEFHERMFQNQGSEGFMERAAFQQIAEELGLDMDAFNSCTGSGKYNEVIEDNISAATRVGVSSTPNFFINDEQYVGNYPLSTFEQVISSIVGAG